MVMVRIGRDVVMKLKSKGSVVAVGNACCSKVP